MWYVIGAIAVPAAAVYIFKRFFGTRHCKKHGIHMVKSLGKFYYPLCDKWERFPGDQKRGAK